MKKIVCFLILLTVSLSLFSASNGIVTPEYLAEVMQNAGYEAKVDQDGDVEFLDQYEMYYWITCSPSEGRLYIQSGWPAALGVSSEKAYKIVNDSNSRFYLIRTFYDSAYRTFYCDYDFYYPNTNAHQYHKERLPVFCCRRCYQIHNRNIYRLCF